MKTYTIWVEQDVPSTGQKIHTAQMITSRQIEMSGKPMGQILAEMVIVCEKKIQILLDDNKEKK